MALGMYSIRFEFLALRFSEFSLSTLDQSLRIRMGVVQVPRPVILLPSNQGGWHAQRCLRGFFTVIPPKPTLEGY